ncbi:MAG: hypothetical protein ACREQD_02725 [Candidatus Binataceae bacterium]
MSRPNLIKAWILGGAAIAGVVAVAPARAGSLMNQASSGSAGTPIVVSNTTPTQLLKANTARFGWTIYCAGTSGTIAVLVEPGDSQGDAAGVIANSVAPSQTAGFPLPANILVSDQDFSLRGIDALHQRVDAEAQGSSPVNCYTWEEQ